MVTSDIAPLPGELNVPNANSRHTRADHSMKSNISDVDDIIFIWLLD